MQQLPLLLLLLLLSMCCICMHANASDDTGGKVADAVPVPVPVPGLAQSDSQGDGVTGDDAGTAVVPTITIPPNSIGLRYIPSLLNASECSHLLSISPVVNAWQPAYDDSTVRTSFVAYVPRAFDGAIKEIERKLCQAANMPIEHLETLQISRYFPYQEHGLHSDGSADDPSIARRITILVYLSSVPVEHGGTTHFPHINDLHVPAVEGAALVWENFDEHGKDHQQAIHAGTPLLKGIKYAMSAWFHSQPLPDEAIYHWYADDEYDEGAMYGQQVQQHEPNPDDEIYSKHDPYYGLYHDGPPLTIDRPMKLIRAESNPPSPPPPPPAVAGAVADAAAVADGPSDASLPNVSVSVSNSDIFPPNEIQLKWLPGLLSPAECEDLIRRVSASMRLEPSKTLSGVEPWRTSHSVYLEEALSIQDANDIRQRIHQRIKQMDNTPVAHLPITHVEPLQVVRYHPGQFFAPHHDSHLPHFRRQHTIIIYLNDLDDADDGDDGAGVGGETVFPNLDPPIRVRPHRGFGLYWSNFDDNGREYKQSLHGGSPLRKGVKWAINYWVYDTPNFPSGAKDDEGQQCPGPHQRDPYGRDEL